LLLLPSVELGQEISKFCAFHTLGLYTLKATIFGGQNMKKINLPILKIVDLLASIASTGVANAIPVPESGATFLFLTIGLATLAALRRKLK
jgi:hypothetical protein